MSEMDELRQERLFDALLSETDHWRATPGAQWRHATEYDEAVATDAALAASLYKVRPPREEAEFARARIARRLDELMAAEPTGPAIPPPQDARARMRARLRAVTAPPAAWSAATLRSAGAARRSVATRPIYAALGRAWLRRLAPLAAAVLIVAFASLAGASAASAQALPESPLYSVKRLDETVLLAISWGDESKGETLSMIANHRLGEATTEANQRRTTEAHALLREFDVAFGQLIDLTAQARAKHEDTTTFARAIQVTLESEQSDAAQAATHGNHSFAAAASASAQAAAAHIHAAGVTLPTAPGNHGKGNGNGNNGNGNGNNGKGNGNGNNGNGQPQQTPGAQATHTPHSNQGAGANPTPTVTPTSGG